MPANLPINTTPSSAHCCNTQDMHTQRKTAVEAHTNLSPSSATTLWRALACENEILYVIREPFSVHSKDIDSAPSMQWWLM